ncbi:hypothetical protein E2C01_101006 [Portunus trituberculatus]|uniref:Uncharacterized protein n=1 Tax=Portunus trituberculatus TaxID=210409 RepID=A0A5B7K9I2_PORTR|nr:hypothetical protein [Portunus trituberculatus]
MEDSTRQRANPADASCLSCFTACSPCTSARAVRRLAEVVLPCYTDRYWKSVTKSSVCFLE